MNGSVSHIHDPEKLMITVKRILKLFFILFITYSQVMGEESSVGPKEDSSYELNADQYDLMTSSRRYQTWGTVSTIAGIGIVSGLTPIAVLVTGLGSPEGGAVMLFPISGGVALTVAGIKMIKKGRELRRECSILPKQHREFRFSFQVQRYFEKQFTTSSSVFEDHPLEPRHWSWWNGKNEPPKPNFAMELGFMSESQIYFGIFGELRYVGAMLVIYYEWKPHKNISLSAGAKAGYLQEYWTQHNEDHYQYGGPELRFGYGIRSVKLVSEFTLWIDRVRQYEYGDYTKSGYYHDPENVGYAPTDLKTGVSPSLSLKLQFAIPIP